VGNAQQLTGPVWRRNALFGLGMLSLMLLGVAASLAAWIVLPMALLQWSPSVVVSGSMRPAIEVGDVVLLRPVADGDVGVDTVVLYDSADRGRVLHRIVQVQPEGAYVTMGDANPTPDSDPVQTEQLRGAAVLLIPWIGGPAAWVVDGRWGAVAGAMAGALCCVRLAAFAFDPAYDPWATAQRVLPATVLITTGARRPAAAGRLLPDEVRQSVIGRLAEQTAVAVARHDSLLGAQP